MSSPPSTLELAKCSGTKPFFAQISTASATIALRISAPLTVDVGQILPSTPSTSTQASPTQPKLSKTTSAISQSHLPLL